MVKELKRISLRTFLPSPSLIFPLIPLVLTLDFDVGCRWFGKNSSQGKLGRLLGEIQIRMRLKVSGDRREIRQSYLPTLFPRLVEPLQERGAVSPTSSVVSLRA